MCPPLSGGCPVGCVPSSVRLLVQSFTCTFIRDLSSLRPHFPPNPLRGFLNLTGETDPLSLTFPFISAALPLAQPSAALGHTCHSLPLRSPSLPCANCACGAELLGPPEVTVALLALPWCRWDS